MNRMPEHDWAAERAWSEALLRRADQREREALVQAQAEIERLRKAAEKEEKPRGRR